MSAALWTIAVAALTGCSILVSVDGLTDGSGASASTPSGDAGAANDATALGEVGTSGGGGDDGSAAPPADAPSAIDTGEPAADGGGGADASDGSVAADVIEEPAPLGPITFVQIASTATGSNASQVSATFTKAQALGDLAIVAIGWTDTAAVVTQVSDSAGNTYALAVGPTRMAPDFSQSLYYASSIAAASAGANTVTVTFDRTATSPDLRIAEYSGLSASSPLDGTGSGSASSTTSCTTGSAGGVYARELIFGAGMSSTTLGTAGASFTIRTVTAQGNMAEDRIASSLGSRSASATQSPSGTCLMQMAIFH